MHSIFDVLFSLLVFLSLVGIPLSLLIAAGICFRRYLSAKKQNESVPDTYVKEELEKRKGYTVIFAAVGGAMVLTVIGVLIFLEIGLG